MIAASVAASASGSCSSSRRPGQSARASATALPGLSRRASAAALTAARRSAPLIRLHSAKGASRDGAPLRRKIRSVASLGRKTLRKRMTKRAPIGIEEKFAPFRRVEAGGTAGAQARLEQAQAPAERTRQRRPATGREAGRRRRGDLEAQLRRAGDAAALARGAQQQQQGASPAAPRRERKTPRRRKAIGAGAIQLSATTAPTRRFSASSIVHRVSRGSCVRATMSRAGSRPSASSPLA